jgi:hypothetical protein
MDDIKFALWSLSIRKKRINGLLELLRKAILEWWTSKTRVNLKKMMLHANGWNEWYMMKPMHFFMETHVMKAHLHGLFCFQVCIYNSIFIVSTLKS